MRESRTMWSLLGRNCEIFIRRSPRNWRISFPVAICLIHPMNTSINHTLAKYSVLLAIILWFGGAAAQSPFENSTAEQYYWRQLHRKEAERERNEERRHQELREQVKAMLPELVADGSAPQKEIIVSTDGPSVFLPPPPSIFEGKRDYILLGLLLLLVPALIASTLIRYKREAEIRLLTGNYLADGTEAATMRMPALFDAPATPTPIVANRNEFDDDRAAAPPSIPGDEFFSKAPERIAALRKLLSEFGKAFDDIERQQVLTKLRELVVLLKVHSDCWELRPAWQMSSALELLLERLLHKGKELTPSTLRTVASAVDVLGDVCVPGVRPDLIITPPMSILAVDDDPLCLRAVVFALEKAGLAPDVAADGEKSVELAAAKAYDVIFMDIQMPGIDGLTATGQIRETKKNQDTPVIFVTVRSDFQTRAQSSRIGGTDLIAKPFLQFEITVKALTFAMRKRLQLAASVQRAAGISPLHPRVNTLPKSQSVQAIPA
jgi:CheY-like chemotaxis protein